MLPWTRSCFVCGEANSFGLQLRFQTDGRIVRTEFIPRPEHNGFKNVVHGGLITTALDEAMVWACAVQTRRFAFCAELNVRFQQPLHPGEHATITGELLTNRRNRVFEAQAEIRNAAGMVLATATGKYLPMPATQAAELMSDVVGNTGSFTLKS